MPALLEKPVAKEKKAGQKPKRHTNAERAKHTAPTRIYHDLNRWLNDIATYAERVLKDSGKLEGYDKVSVARLIDPHLREWAWRTMRRIKAIEAGEPDLPIPKTPPPPEPHLDLGLPE